MCVEKPLNQNQSNRIGALGAVILPPPPPRWMFTSRLVWDFKLLFIAFQIRRVVQRDYTIDFRQDALLRPQWKSWYYHQLTFLQTKLWSSLVEGDEGSNRPKYLHGNYPYLLDCWAKSVHLLLLMSSVTVLDRVGKWLWHGWPNGCFLDQTRFDSSHRQLLKEKTHEIKKKRSSKL